VQDVSLHSKKRRKNSLHFLTSLLIHSSQVQSHVQISRPVDPIFNELAEAVFSFENTEDRLLSRTMRLPQLQSLVNNILSQPSWSVSENGISDLIRVTEDLDHELAVWASNVPPGWSYSVATNLNTMSSPELSNSCYMPAEIHGYPNFYIARVWNLYRVARLIIQSILLRAASWLCFPGQNGWQHPKNTHIEKFSGQLVNDICASVPFLLGYDLSQLKRPTANISSREGKFIWPQSSTCKVGQSGKNTGRFSLIWPLYLSCSVPSISETQQRWMRAQLTWIAEYGEPQAKLVSDAQSQTLLGRPEDFRFDCV
jgi:hypothetical protein